MATRLRNLKIKKVDFVDEGANPDAHIKMIKRKNGDEQAAEEDSKKESVNILKKLFRLIGKAAGMDQGEIDNAMEEIQKGSSMSFTERINAVNTGKIADEIWDICYALQSSFCSILSDEELDSTDSEKAMRESLNEFYALVGETIPKWSSGKVANIVKKSEEASESELATMKAAVKRLNKSIEKAGKDANSDDNDNLKGEEKKMGMTIDKSRLTDAERAFLESIEKRYGTDDEAVPDSKAAETVLASAPAEPTVTKSATQPAADTTAPAEESDSIYKGLHPAVRAELESLKKFREEAEARELTEVAKKYAIIGKKEEELVPLFKSLQAAGGTAYNDMIAVLDQAVTAVEKSGVFSEIGKSGHGSSAVGAAEAKVEAIAKGYMEKDSSMDYASAMAKAWEDNPELMDEYEAEAGF